MKNKIIILMLTVFACVTLASCGVFVDSTSAGNSDSSVTDTSTVTITFKQEGKADVIKTVEQGATLTDIPMPAEKTGYTVAWDRTDFSNITENITVKAKETAKEYTVTLNANGGTVSPNTFTVSYGQSYSIINATIGTDKYMFVAWSYLGQAISSKGVWDIDEEDGTIELIATWESYTGEY